MEFTPLADPFTIQFEKDNIEFKARVIYAKSLNSCTNIFNVTIEWPEGIEPFCLREKAVHDANNDRMIWIDEQGRESVFYEVIGSEISRQMKNQLGVILLDTTITDEEKSENL